MAVYIHQPVVRQQDLDAAFRLLQRIYTPEEKSLPMVVFGTTARPIPTCFADPQHPFTIELVDRINWTMIKATTYTIVAEWQFDPGLVDYLAPNDERITVLRQKLSAEIDQIPLVKALRRDRSLIVLNLQNYALCESVRKRSHYSPALRTSMNAD